MEGVTNNPLHGEPAGEELSGQAALPQQERYLPLDRASERRVLPEPLSAIISFPSLEGKPFFNVDVLDLSEGGLRLQIALPPGLSLEKGQEGVISLILRRSDPPCIFNFTVRWVEINSLISVAGVAFEQPLTLPVLPSGGSGEANPVAKLTE
ncbi:PilZ domain-containing protein [Synechococcus sp. CS-1333]|uniref:PilZ domain-containing protein n=1 Tax=Synechococcus sp. CS-1333 TaxID=2848638 RepID=UPI00223B185E|nr:PilZ domain-containing protein [Synechococcus sp. CS-1333]